MKYDIMKSSQVLQESECVLMDQTSQRDEYGNVVTVWTEGIHFNATFSKQGEALQNIAQQLGAAAEYTIITSKNIILDDLKVIKRLSDGMYFRIKSDGVDSATPPSSDLDMRVVKAQEWKI